MKNHRGNLPVIVVMTVGAMATALITSPYQAAACTEPTPVLEIEAGLETLPRRILLDSPSTVLSTLHGWQQDLQCADAPVSPQTLAQLSYLLGVSSVHRDRTMGLMASTPALAIQSFSTVKALNRDFPWQGALFGRVGQTIWDAVLPPEAHPPPALPDGHGPWALDGLPIAEGRLEIIPPGPHFIQREGGNSWRGSWLQVPASQTWVLLTHPFGAQPSGPPEASDASACEIRWGVDRVDQMLTDLSERIVQGTSGTALADVDAMEAALACSNAPLPPATLARLHQVRGMALLEAEPAGSKEAVSVLWQTSQRLSTHEAWGDAAIPDGWIDLWASASITAQAESPTPMARIEGDGAPWHLNGLPLDTTQPLIPLVPGRSLLQWWEGDGWRGQWIDNPSDSAGWLLQLPGQAPQAPTAMVQAAAPAQSHHNSERRLAVAGSTLGAVYLGTAATVARLNTRDPPIYASPEVARGVRIGAAAVGLGAALTLGMLAAKVAIRRMKGRSANHPPRPTNLEAQSDNPER